MGPHMTSCPNCGAQNSVRRSTCYACERPLHPEAEPVPGRQVQSASQTSRRCGKSYWVWALVLGLVGIACFVSALPGSSDEAAGLAFMGALLIWITPIVVGVKSAKSKGLSPHWMWFGVHPLGGWIAYIVVACRRGRDAMCTSCGHTWALSFGFCPTCGAQLRPTLGHPQAALGSVVVPSSPSGPVALQSTVGPAPDPLRPKVVTVLGVLGIIVGVSGIIGLPFSIAQLSGAWQPNEATRLLLEDRLYRKWMTVNVPLGALAAVLWLATGVGLLRLRPWARSASLWLLNYGIAMQVLGFIVLTEVFFILPVSDGVRNASQQAMHERFLIACLGLLGGLIALGLCIWARALMARPQVTTAFGSM